MKNLMAELKSNNFLCSEVLLSNIQKLNEVTGHKHQLREIHSKFHNIDSLPHSEKVIVQELGRELQQQAIIRQRLTSLNPIIPELS